jgi:hypothetical protein
MAADHIETTTLMVLGLLDAGATSRSLGLKLNCERVVPASQGNGTSFSWYMRSAMRNEEIEVWIDTGKPRLGTVRAYDAADGSR